MKTEKQELTDELRERLKNEFAQTKEEFIEMCEREYVRGLGNDMSPASKFDLGYAEAMRICRNLACGIEEQGQKRKVD